MKNWMTNHRKNEEPIILKVEKLKSHYGDLVALEEASLKIYQGNLVTLFGPNGHGKSTLLKTISGLLKPTSGSVCFFGDEIAGLASEKIVQKGLVYVPEDRNLFLDMTVIENLRLGAYNRNARKNISENIKKVLSLFPRLGERKSQKVSTLSGGEARMLAIGRGLMSGAKMLLIDEPSIGLSPLLTKQVFMAISKIHKMAKCSILMVEQEVDYPLKISDRIYLMKKGRIEKEKMILDTCKADIERYYFE